MSAREDREDDVSSEGEGDDIRPYGAANDGLNDSSEEEEEDEEEARRIKEGFIVDDDEDEDGEGDFKAGEGDGEEDEEARRARRKEKRRKKRKRENGSAELLEEDDLDLIAENTGQVRPSQGAKDARALKRFRRRASGSGGESEENPDDVLPELGTMFDAEPAPRPRRAEQDEDEDSDGGMDDFIVDEEDGEGGDAAEIKRRKEERKKARRSKDDKWAGVSRETQTELMDIFGDGYDYDDGLPDEDEVLQTPEAEERRLQDFFDPADIASRFMTDKDEFIRRADIPERHQLSTSTLSTNALVAPQQPFPSIDEATSWVAPRVSPRTSYMFLDADASYGQREIPPRYDLLEQYMAAVKDALNSLFNEHLEVPYLWHHKRDSYIEATPNLRNEAVFLNEDELWTCYDLGIKYKAIYARITSLEATYSAMKDAQPGFADPYFEDFVLVSPSGTAHSSVEAAGEASEWLELRYPRLVKAVKEAEAEERQAERKRAGGLESARQNRDTLGGLLDKFGLSPAEVASHYVTGRRHPRSTDYPVEPLDTADEFVNADNHLLDNTTVLSTARSMLISEFGKDPILRDQFRTKFRQYGLVSTMPTERGKIKIDQYHIYFPFKYLKDKPLLEYDNVPNFPQILAAEAEGLIKITFSVPDEVIREIEESLIECYCSVDPSAHADKWNALRIDIIQQAVHSQLIPAAAASTREYLRERNEDAIATECALELKQRVNVTPFCIRDMRPGDSPGVVALTCGRGFKDAIVGVFVENTGRVLRQIKLDDLTTPESKEALIAFLSSTKPDVVIIGGFNLATHQMHIELKKTLRQMAGADESEAVDPMDPFAPPRPYDIEAPLLDKEIPLAFVHDAVARVYMNSVQGAEEHPSWPANMRYAFALARYAQDPLNEHCALGVDVIAVQYTTMQRYVSQEKLLISLERALVNVVNAVGVDINAAYTDSYLQKMLPFLAGLGPRKVESLLKGISKAGGSLVNRTKLLTESMVGPVIVQNLAAFLYLNPGVDIEESDIIDKVGEYEGPNPLDSTRIHPLDYELAYGLCDQLMGVDPEDLGQVNQSIAALNLMQSDDNSRLMAEVDFPQYAADIKQQNNGVSKAHVIRTIMEELLVPYKDRRRDFFLPNEDEIFTMLTGETPFTLNIGLIVTARIINIRRENAFGKLDSGIEANIPAVLMHDSQQGYAGDYVSKGQTVRGAVVDMDKKAFSVTLAINAANMSQARPVGKQDPDPYTDADQKQREDIEASRKKRQDMASTARVIKHPLWNLFNKQQAETHLANKSRGDAVIRPSSQGLDHLAITWKVDEGIYQHVDVLELEKSGPYALGKLFRVGTASYMDLDEVLVNHIKAVASQVDKLTEHEKYYPENMIDQRLDDYVKAHPGQSAYGFCLDSGKPGWAQLRFLSKSIRDGGRMQAWPVRILPGAFKLFSAEVPGMRELCDAFKAQYRAKLEEQKSGNIGRTPRAPGATPMGGTPMGGRTPGGYAGGRTPGMFGGRTPGLGGATPGFPSATPNPYQMPSPYRPPGVNAYGTTPAVAGGRTPAFGGRTPGYGAPPGAGGYTPMGPPPGMPPPPPPGPPAARPSAGFINPERMRMMAQQGGDPRY